MGGTTEWGILDTIDDAGIVLGERDGVTVPVMPRSAVTPARLARIREYRDGIVDRLLAEERFELKPRGYGARPPALEFRTSERERMVERVRRAVTDRYARMRPMAGFFGTIEPDDAFVPFQYDGDDFSVLIHPDGTVLVRVPMSEYERPELTGPAPLERLDGLLRLLDRRVVARNLEFQTFTRDRWDRILAMMDDGIRRRMRAMDREGRRQARYPLYEDRNDYLLDYCRLHRERFGEDFALARHPFTGPTPNLGTLPAPTSQVSR